MGAMPRASNTVHAYVNWQVRSHDPAVWRFRRRKRRPTVPGLRWVAKVEKDACASVDQAGDLPLRQGAAMHLLTVDRLRELYALEANLGVRAATR
jgi:hypothetical protein